jgi:hypothetical protein
LFAAGVNDTGGKFAAGVVDTGGSLPPVSLTPAANFSRVSTTLVKQVAKFAASVVDTGSNLPPVSLIPVINLELRISPQILEKI